MTYIQEMKAVREFVKTISKNIPSVAFLVDEITHKSDELDLKVLAMSDLEFQITAKQCQLIEDKLYGKSKDKV